MKEQLYTIPVTDAFQSDCECPLCKMKQDLEQSAIEYTLGPSYMEDDNRAMTDEMGFCEKHIKDLYQQKNRLGLALILSTHMSKITKDLKRLCDSAPTPGKSFLKKKNDASALGEYVNKLSGSCFICSRTTNTFDRYIDTIFHLYKKDNTFSSKITASKGFCTYHYALLYDRAPDFLAKEQLTQFLADIQSVYFSNMERMQEDIEWFINKFDYRYQNEPWKNAKDALPRTILKTHSSTTPDTKE
ncbi:MAG: hypothetical protein HFJ06_12395 [Lachnospiraceae bacterium]|nr:hypothetical protein [Lachnospiraceae bacterium]